MMNFDTEKAVIVIDAIEELAKMPDSKYTFDYFCRNNNLYHDNDVHRISEVVISCPFHEDASPSLSINEEKRIWHCFSCDSGGNYINFLTEYDRRVLGSDVTFYQKVNELLSNDRMLQAKVGFSTIIRKKSLYDEFVPLEQERFVYKENKIPSSYLELGVLLVKKGCSKEQIRLAILLMQSDLDVKFIYNQIFGKSAEASLSSNFSIEELNKE